MHACCQRYHLPVTDVSSEKYPRLTAFPQCVEVLSTNNFEAIFLIFTYLIKAPIIGNDTSEIIQLRKNLDIATELLKQVTLANVNLQTKGISENKDQSTLSSDSILFYISELKSDINEFRRGNVVIKRGQTLFIAQVTSNPNIKLDLGKIYKSADRYVQKIVIPSKKEVKNILLWRPSDISEIEGITAKNGDWIILIKSATNVLKGDNFVFVYPELLQNKTIVKRGEVVTSEILEGKDLSYKKINSKIKILLRKTRDKIKLRGSIVNEITTRGDFIKKIRDTLKMNQNNKLRVYLISLH